MDFENKIVVVTGASRGLGFAVAKQLGAAGAQVVATARTVGGLEELDDAIQQAGGLPAVLVPLDLTSGHEQIDRLGASLFERFGHVDTFIHAAAMLGTLGPLAHTDPNETQRVMSVNTFSAYRFLRSFDALFKAAPAARAVTINCTLGDDTVAYWGAYRASKAALRTFTETYARESDINTNSYTPAPMSSKLYTAAFPGISTITTATAESEAKKLIQFLAG